MNQGCIEDRNDTILRSDGANIYAGFGVSTTSSRQHVLIVRQFKQQKDMASVSSLLTKFGYIMEKMYVRPEGEKAVEKQASFDSARLKLSLANSCHSYLA